MLLMSAIPIFDKSKIHLFRAELKGYFSFNLKEGGIAVPWLINRTGWEVLLLCDGCNTVSEIIREVHIRYKNVTIKTIQKDILKVFGDLTRMQILRWKQGTESLAKLACDNQKNLKIKEISSEMQPIADAFLREGIERGIKGNIFTYSANSYINAGVIWPIDKPLENPIALSYVEMNHHKAIGCSISIIGRSINGEKLSDAILLVDRIICFTEEAYDRLPVFLRGCVKQIFIKYGTSFERVIMQLVCTNIEKKSNIGLQRLLDEKGFRLSYTLRSEWNYQDIECYDFIED